MEEMKADVERAEAQVKAKREQSTSSVSLQEVQQGNRPLPELEEELAKRQADLQVQVQVAARTSFCNKRPRIYHNVYQEILQATDYYCKQNGIDMVLQVQRRSGRRQSPGTASRPTVQAGRLVSEGPGHHAGDFGGVESVGH